MRRVLGGFGVFLCLSLLVASCGEDAGSAGAGSGGNGGKTDDGGEGSAFSKTLEGREDPVAQYLRQAAKEDGTLEGDYQSVLDGVGEVMGCDRATQSSFAILLTRAEMFPRLMFTRCSQSPKDASRFFMSTQSDDGALPDVDPRNLKMIGWDDAANVYRTYELLPQADGRMKATVEPAKCSLCHTGPASLDNRLVPFAPVMNELVNPWTLWNAEPEFRSHRFEDELDPKFDSAPVYQAMTQGQLDSASNFEKHIRAAHDRVANARVRVRRDPPSLDQSLALLRPLFCDETLNYVSENHDTGETRADVLLDDSIRRLYLKVRPDNWPWDWLNDGKLRLPLPKDGEEPLAVMPVRGESTLQLDVALVSRRVLGAEEVLRVRALDWERPVFSEFRCKLYQDAEARVRISPPDVGGYASNTELIKALYEEIMTAQVVGSDGTRATVKLAPADGAALVSVPDATDPASLDALVGGDLGGLSVTLDGFGEQLEARFQAFQGEEGRARLEEERVRRACLAGYDYPAAPAIPGSEGCQ